VPALSRLDSKVDEKRSYFRKKMKLVIAKYFKKY
jgi:hypothetical protein